jgi:hypothetical protein
MRPYPVIRHQPLEEYDNGYQSFACFFNHVLEVLTNPGRDYRVNRKTRTILDS